MASCPAPVKTALCVKLNSGDNNLWGQLLSIVKEIIPILLPLLGVWLGWRLNSHSQRKQNRLDRLADSFTALKEIRQIAENVPPDLNVDELTKRLGENDFCKKLNHRLIRLFGLRTELIPFLDNDIVDFIDNQLRPLYKIETGAYDLRDECVPKFATCCLRLRTLANRVEKRLCDEYEKLRK